ncbi:hypothetical protein AAG570_009273 [Ranatra chinensis]|uniref:Uncharacterized protein n=1 Tax=Ranatra chinensis TaxID=642074 RepID=A0ABD0ZGJ4_9HEMI
MYPTQSTRILFELLTKHDAWMGRCDKASEHQNVLDNKRKDGVTKCLCQRITRCPVPVLLAAVHPSTYSDRELYTERVPRSERRSIEHQVTVAAPARLTPPLTMAIRRNSRYTAAGPKEKTLPLPEEELTAECARPPVYANRIYSPHPPVGQLALPVETLYTSTECIWHKKDQCRKEIFASCLLQQCTKGVLDWSVWAVPRALKLLHNLRPPFPVWTEGSIDLPPPEEQTGERVPRLATYGRTRVPTSHLENHFMLARDLAARCQRDCAMSVITGLDWRCRLHPPADKQPERAPLIFLPPDPDSKLKVFRMMKVLKVETGIKHFTSSNRKIMSSRNHPRHYGLGGPSGRSRSFFNFGMLNWDEASSDLEGASNTGSEMSETLSFTMPFSREDSAPLRNDSWSQFPYIPDVTSAGIQVWGGGGRLSQPLGSETDDVISDRCHRLTPYYKYDRIIFISRLKASLSKYVQSKVLNLLWLFAIDCEARPPLAPTVGHLRTRHYVRHRDARGKPKANDDDSVSFAYNMLCGEGRLLGHLISCVDRVIQVEWHREHASDVANAMQGPPETSRTVEKK